MILFVLVGIFLFFIILIHSIIYQPVPRSVHLPFQKGEKVAVVIGATGTVGIEYIKQFLAEGYTVIAASRREGRWNALVKEMGWDPQMNVSLFWRKVDVRVLRSVKALFDEISATHPNIDVAVNCFMIQDTFSLPTTFVEDDSILIRMPNGYNQQHNLGVNMNSENSFFTNFIGLWNVNEVQKKHGIQKIINPSHINPPTDALLGSFDNPNLADLYL